MFVSFFRSLFKRILALFSILSSSKSAKSSRDVERNQSRRKYDYQLVGQNNGDEFGDETDMEIDTENISLKMHTNEFKDKCGSLRFRLQYMPNRDNLSVTILDAQDLPAMDANGKSDPYVEVILRPKGTKFTTICKSNCLNPSFNETYDFTLNETDLNQPDTKLVLKLYDKDLGMLPCDDLIGVINLPLNLLDLSQESGKLYTCLIGHDSKDEKVTKDTARMNLKISAQSAEIFNLKLEMKNCKESLEETKKEASDLKIRAINAEMQQFNQSPNLSDDSLNMNTEIDAQSVPNSPRHQSSPIESQRIRKRQSLPSRSYSNERSESDAKSFQLMTDMHNEIQRKEEIIEQLKQLIEVLKQRERERDAPIGLLEIGLCLRHVTSKIEISVISAAKLTGVDLNGLSDPYVKVKVFRTNAELDKEHKFKTEVISKTLSPVWNAKFTVENVTEADLPHMSIEFAVWDHNTITPDTPLGQVKVGPNTAQDNYHWEEMIKNDGNLVKMLHPLREK